MTFKIVDGREHFYQWDLNRQIIVDDPTIKEVHFCNRLDNCSLVVEVKNGIANVPNILLQNGFSVRVFAYDGFATLFDKVFEVKARTRPADYVYEETDILSVRQLEEELRIEAEELRNEIDERLTDATAVIDERLDAVEAGLITDGFATTEYVDEAVKNVSVDLSGYAKESYVDSAITQSVSGLAKKEDIPSIEGLASESWVKENTADKVHYHAQYLVGSDLDKYAKKSEVPSIEGLASETYVDDAIKNIDIPEVDLTGYATEEYVDNAINNIPEDPTVIVTSLSTKDDIDSILAVGKLPLFKYEGVLSSIGDRYIPFVKASDISYTFESLNGNGYYITAILNLSTGEWMGPISSPLQASTDLTGFLSYLESQTLSKEQKNIAKENLELPYIVSEAEIICENKTSGMSTGWSSVSISIGIDGATKLKAMPVGTKFKVTAADAGTNPTFTETIECELLADSKFKILTDKAGLVFFDNFGSPSISSYALSTYKKDTSGKGLPYNMYFTVVAGEFEAANVLDSRLVDLSGYITREEFASIKTAEGGAY